MRPVILPPCLPTRLPTRTRVPTGTHSGAGLSCKWEALLLSSVPLSDSRWFVLIDDDAFIRVQLLKLYLLGLKIDERARRVAFSPYPCGDERCGNLGAGAEELGRGDQRAGVHSLPCVPSLCFGEMAEPPRVREKRGDCLSYKRTYYYILP